MSAEQQWSLCEFNHWDNQEKAPTWSSQVLENCFNGTNIISSLKARAENHFYECISSGRQQFHKKQNYLTPLKGGNSVIYKDSEGALSTKNEGHSSIWQDKKVLALLYREECRQERAMPVSRNRQRIPELSAYHKHWHTHKQIIMSQRRMHEYNPIECKNRIHHSPTKLSLSAYLFSNVSVLETCFHFSVGENEMTIKFKHI